MTLVGEMYFVALVVSLVIGSQALRIPSNVLCPGGEYTCPDGNTCCSIGFDKYGCCPYYDAVCCGYSFCCPNGYFCGNNTCYARSDTESKVDKEIPEMSLSLVSSMVHQEKAKEVTCKDGSECPSGNTCCMLSSGGYGCCPYPNAVCCSDHEHCCPSGYTCDVSQGTCNHEFFVTPMVKKTPATKKLNYNQL